MHARPIAIPALLFAAVAVAGAAHSQERRSSNPQAGNAPPLTGTVMNRRFPFAGVWDGSRQMEGRDDAHPIGMAFTVTDSAKTIYTGALIMPDGGRIPFPQATVAHDTLTWRSPNSGGGTWVYTATLVGTDTLAGTLVLRDAPWEPATDPSGTFALVRRRPGAR